MAAGLARLDDDPKLLMIIVAAFLAKMVGATLRYFVLKDVYGSQGDAERYYLAGLDLAEQFRAGSAVLGEISGTRFLEILSGVSFLGLPKSQLAGFFFFSWLAFLGLVLFTRAIRVALPDGNHRRYELLVFFLPTILFWPSSIGKEAWMVLMLGLASYGVAKVLTHRNMGLIPLALGVWGATVVRPHIGLIIVAAFGPAWFLRSQGRNRLGLNPFLRAIGLVGIVAVLFVVVS
jgi:hypothetical protein